MGNQDSKIQNGISRRLSHSRKSSTGQFKPKPPFLALPHNILLKILSYLNFDELIICAAAHPYIRKVAHDSSLKNHCIFVWGENEKNYKLGIQTPEVIQSSPLALPIPFTEKITQIKPSFFNTLIVLNTGDYMGWGQNKSFELGMGIEGPVHKPQWLRLLKNLKFKQILNGARHYIGITDTDVIYGWGSDEFGRLGGDAPEFFHKTPQILSFFSDKKVKHLSLGYRHTLALLESGEIYGMGDNTHGQALGIPTKEWMITKTTAVTGLEPNIKIENIYCGCDTSFLLTKDGTVYGMGVNENYELGLGHQAELKKPEIVPIPKAKRVTQIVCSYAATHCFALLENGDIFGWGRNHHAQIGLGHIKEIKSPQRFTFFRKSEITLHVGHNCSFAHTEGELYGWGYNQTGQLGVGHAKPVVKPEKLLALLDKKSH